MLSGKKAAEESGKASKIKEKKVTCRPMEGNDKAQSNGERQSSNEMGWVWWTENVRNTYQNIL